MRLGKVIIISHVLILLVILSYKALLPLLGVGWPPGRVCLSRGAAEAPDPAYYSPAPASRARTPPRDVGGGGAQKCARFGRGISAVTAAPGGAPRKRPLPSGEMSSDLHPNISNRLDLQERENSTRDHTHNALQDQVKHQHEYIIYEQPYKRVT